MAKGGAENDNELIEICRGFKHDLEDALGHLNEMSSQPDVPPYVATLKEKLADVKNYVDSVRVFAMDEESLPKRP